MLDELTPFRISTGASVRAMNGGRLHLSHGPIDLIVMAEGEPVEVSHAFEQATLVRRPPTYRPTIEFP